jgi:hypothetical protein
MKRILLLIGLIFLLIGCATVGENTEPISTTVNEYHAVDIYISDIPKISVTIPEYGWSYMLDRDSVDPIYLSKNILMIYFDKEGPDMYDPGHAVAIIVDASRGYIQLFFQTTIHEEERYFIYDPSGIPREVQKPTYRNHLQMAIDKDKSKISL